MAVDDVDPLLAEDVPDGDTIEEAILYVATLQPTQMILKKNFYLFPPSDRKRSYSRKFCLNSCPKVTTGRVLVFLGFS